MPIWQYCFYHILQVILQNNSNIWKINKIFVNIVRGYHAITNLSLAHKNKRMYFKIKFMFKYISTKYRKHFLLLSIRINITFNHVLLLESRMKTNLFNTVTFKTIQKQENIITNFTAITFSVALHNWMKSREFRNYLENAPVNSTSYGLTHKQVLPRITWVSILLTKAGNNTAVYRVTWTYQLCFHQTLPNYCKY